MRSPIRMIAAAVVAAGLVAASLTGCSPQSPGAAGGVLTIGTGGVFTRNNNPFAPTSSAVQNGWTWLIYEPLMQNNAADPTAEPTPWLASAAKWSSDYRSVVFTARSGVKWSDGKPFTAADIAYTFGLLKDDEALNTGALPIESAQATGDAATITFSSPQFVNTARVESQFVVPRHIWSKIDQPANYADENPVGTGPFTFTSSTSSVAKLTKNPTYWQASKVQPGTVIYQALQGNDAILNALAAHKVDWASSFALNQKTGFVDRAPKTNLAWNLSRLGIDAFVMNTAKKPFDDPQLRKAVSMVVNRTRAVKLATGGLLSPVTSVTGLPQPTGDAFIADAYKGKQQAVDVDGAKQVLAAAGYTLSGGSLRTPDGKAVSMTLTDPAGYTDYLTELQVIAEDLKQIGIKTSLDTPSADAWQASLASGDFDAAMLYSNTGATPYDLYATYMDQDMLKPIGQTATGNVNRFRSSAAGAALKAYANAGGDADRKRALDALQKVWVEETPAVAVVAKAETGMFTTVNWTGWPSAADPYGSPGILNVNLLLVVTSLKAAK